jgi:hypothetical protein
MATAAISTVTAGQTSIRYDPVPNAEARFIGHTRTHSVNDARQFMSHLEGECYLPPSWYPAAEKVEIGPTDTASRDLDRDFTRARLGYVVLFEDKLAALQD